jgi:hypothetical protein
MRLIDADALLEVVNKIFEVGDNEHVDDVIYLITNAPTVEREGWISVEDRLPEIDEEVVILSTWNTKHAGVHRRPNRFKVMGSAVLYSAKYWQSLPAAPSDKE